MHWDPILMTAERAVGIVCLLLMFLIICLNVVLRYLFSEPLYWAEEASNYLFVWIGFLSCAHGVADGGHIRVTVFVGALGERTQRRLSVALDLLLLATFGTFILPAWRALDTLHISTGLQIHERHPYAIVPVTMALCFIHVAFRLVRGLRAAGRPA